jgi:hypothetical protein
VLNEIPNVLLSHYGVDIFSAEFVNAIYHGDLQRFDRGIHGSLKATDPAAYQRARLEFLSQKVALKDSHLHAALGHLAHGRQKQVILVIDNADQRDFQVQQEAFLIAQELAATRNLLVFVALRPSTFYVSKTTGALSGYQNKILTIAPPPADEVLYRRITFAVRIAQGKIAPAALEGIRFRLNNIVYFLDATLRSIRSNVAIKTFLGNITGGNTRLVIELITGFCGSPNVDSEKIVNIEKAQGRYDVPLHEFTKHALLGDYAYYHPQSSLVACNIFDVSTADPREHFLSGLLIAFLSSSAGLKDNDGFVAGSRVMQEMVTFGYSEEQIRFCLRRLAAKRLIETPHAQYREIDVPDNEVAEQFYYRATSIGIYHVRYWMGEFSFLDATCTDTPIFDSAIRGDIFERAASFDIRDRFARSTEFKSYLEHQWHQSNITAVYFDLSALFKLQEDSFNSVKRFIERGQHGIGRRE